MRIKILLISSISVFLSCSNSDENPATNSTPIPPNEAMYFPPNTGTWETKTPESLGWNTTNIAALDTYLTEKTPKVLLFYTTEK